MTRFAAGAASLVGQVRAANEDSFLVVDGLVAVADGMGGHQAGEVASAETVAVLGAAAGAGTLEDLVAAVHLANRRVNERAAADEDLRGMGTTVCVAGLVRYDGAARVAVLNVGDSRIYLFADGQLSQLTEDHSLVEALVREGRITAAEAEVHPQRNVLTRALGVEPLVVVDAWLLDPADGDRLLLCSDGLFNELPEARIAGLLGEGEDPELTARRLAAEAEAAGGRDNITVVVVDLVDTGAAPAPLGDRSRRISTPAVDLSDLDDGPRTETRLAPVVGAGTDAGGPGDAGPDDPEPDETPPGDTVPRDDGPVPGPGAADAAEPLAERDDPDATLDRHAPDGAAAPTGAGSRPDRRAGWRGLLFVVVLVATVGVAGALIFGWLLTEDPVPNEIEVRPTSVPPTTRVPSTTATTTTTTTTQPPPTTTNVFGTFRADPADPTKALLGPDGQPLPFVPAPQPEPPAPAPAGPAPPAGGP